MSLRLSEERFKSTCSYCGVGCGVEVIRSKNGKIKVEGDKNHPVNKGMLCSKGMNLHYASEDRTDRLLYPMMRSNRALPPERVSWDTALDRAAAVFKSIIARYGPDSVGFYVSGQCLTEEYYIVNKLIKGFIGTNNIDTNSRLCMSSAVAGYKYALGEDAVPGSYEDIELADLFFIAGANPAWCHPILFRRIEAAKAANPSVKIIVADPRRTQSAAMADLHLQINPGTDVTLFHAIGRELIENNFTDVNFIIDHTEGFEAYKNRAFLRNVEEAAEICGVPAADIRTAARWIGEAKGYMPMWTMGLNQSVIGVNKNVALLNLSLITGKIGKPGNGPFSLTGQPNAMGGREVGGMANLLSAHRDLSNPEHRRQVADFWGVESVPAKPGLTAVEMMDGLLDGRLKAIWIICTNPVVSWPDAGRAEEALRKAKFVVVQDVSTRSDTVEFADLVLPAAAWAEKEGTMTNSERRISLLEKVIDAPGEALPDIEIIARFAEKMGFKQSFDYKNASEIFDEHCQLTAGTNIDISGLSYSYLRKHGSVQWPFRKGAANGTSRLFEDKKFYTPGGKARLADVPDENLSEPLTPEMPLVLLTGRIRDQWHTMTRTGKVNKLKQHISKSYVEIHPADAASRGIAEGDMTEVWGHRGRVVVPAKVTDEVKMGTIFMPMHWGKSGAGMGRANNLTNTLFDPVSKEPDFKFAAAQAQKYRKPKEKIVVIGAGAGAYGFVRAYRALCPEDEIEVFGKEPLPFYNRVMLPDYISGAQRWEQLVKMSGEEEKSAGVKFHKGVNVTGIDRIQKTILDENGNVHSYDKLILATGSRAFIPPGVPDLQGIFSMRSKADADAFMAHLSLSESGKVVIVGGGLLGLEMTASLREIGYNVVLIQRSSRLMDRQLDEVGSGLLHEEISEMGVDVYYNDEVESYYGSDSITAIRLKSGEYIKCNAVLFAVGTRPNIETAKAAGIEYNRGVPVNHRLQTSDPNIFAIGEIAELNNMMWGITAAAEQQAEVLARSLSGDPAAEYSGSLSMNLLKITGVQLCSLGIPEKPPGDDYEEVVFLDRAKRYYKKCIIHNDKLVGAILIGDKSEFNEFRDLISNQTELSEKRLTLLRSGQKGEEPIGRPVCSCNNVGEGNLLNKIKAGCTEHSELCKITGAGMGCGSCRPEVKIILEKYKEEHVPVGT